MWKSEGVSSRGTTLVKEILKEKLLKAPDLIAYLGPEGTFSQMAALNHFGKKSNLFACENIEDVFSAVELGKARFGVVPIENSTEGAVNNTQDCLLETTVFVSGEVVIPIEHQLLVTKQTDGIAIEKIASHKQSLAQCRNWLSKNYPSAELIECSSNAEAARLAATTDKTAAIAGELAAKIYNLVPAMKKIQDREHNSTRFFVLSQEKTRSSSYDKTSILVYTENKPGALFRILEPFENLKISLTKIETRPAKVEAWEYVFFIDFEGHTEDEVIKRLFGRLESCTAEFKVLGSYPVAHIKK